MTDAKTRVMPSPLPPTEAELAAWNAMTREEQIAFYRAHFSHPDCEHVSSTTMTEVLAEARKRAARRRD